MRYHWFFITSALAVVCATGLLAHNALSHASDAHVVIHVSGSHEGAPYEVARFPNGIVVLFYWGGDARVLASLSAILDPLEEKLDEVVVMQPGANLEGLAVLRQRYVIGRVWSLHDQRFEDALAEIIPGVPVEDIRDELEFGEGISLTLFRTPYRNGAEIPLPLKRGTVCAIISYNHSHVYVIPPFSTPIDQDAIAGHMPDDAGHAYLVLSQGASSALWSKSFVDTINAGATVIPFEGARSDSYSHLLQDYGLAVFHNSKGGVITCDENECAIHEP